MTVYSVHDLNKLGAITVHYRSYNPIGVKENLQKNLKESDSRRFSRNYHDYLEDITTLARSHSAHSLQLANLQIA